MRRRARFESGATRGWREYVGCLRSDGRGRRNGVPTRERTRDAGARRVRARGDAREASRGETTNTKSIRRRRERRRRVGSRERTNERRARRREGVASVRVALRGDPVRARGVRARGKIRDSRFARLELDFWSSRRDRRRRVPPEGPRADARAPRAAGARRRRGHPSQAPRPARAGVAPRGRFFDSRRHRRRVRAARAPRSLLAFPGVAPAALLAPGHSGSRGRRRAGRRGVPGVDVPVGGVRRAPRGARRVFARGRGAVRAARGRDAGFARGRGVRARGDSAGLPRAAPGVVARARQAARRRGGGERRGRRRRRGGDARRRRGGVRRRRGGGVRRGRARRAAPGRAESPVRATREGPTW